MEHANHDKHRLKTSSGTSSTRGDKILNLWLNWIALENTKLLSIHFTHEERIVEMIALYTRFQYLFISGLIPNGQTALSLQEIIH